MAEEYDEVMTAEEYAAAFGGGSTPNITQYDEVMTPEEYQTQYGPKNGSFLSMNTLENAPKSLAKGVGLLASLGAMLQPQTAMQSSLGGIKGLIDTGTYQGAMEGYRGALQNSPSMQAIAAVDEARKDYIGDPAYDSIGGKYLDKALQMAPTAIIPGGGGIVARLATALASGAGGQAALDVGAPEVVGNVVGALGTSGTISALKSLTPAAKVESAQLAARDIVGKFDDVGAVAQSLKAAREAENKVPLIQRQSENYLPKFSRTAEIAQRPGMASFEESLRRTNPDFKSTATIQDIAREEARQRMFAGLSPKGIDKVSAALKVRTGLEEGLAAVKDDVSKFAEKAFSVGGEIVSSPVKRAVTGNINQFTRSGARQISGDFKKLADNFRKLPAKTDLQTLQDYRSAFGEYSKVTAVSRTVDRMTARVARKARDAIDASVETAIQKGDLPKSAATAWRKMIAARTTQGVNYERGAVANILKKDSFNSGYKLSNSKVFDKIQTPEDAVQLMAALKGNRNAIDGAREGVLAKIYEKSYSPTTEQFMPQTFMKNVNALNNIGDKILTPGQVNVLNKIATNYKSQKSVANLAYRASTGNSITAEATPMIDLIKNSVQSHAVGKIRAGILKIPVLGDAIDTVFNIVKNPAQREAMINSELVKIASSPQYAEMLLSKNLTKSRPVLEALGSSLKASAMRLSDIPEDQSNSEATMSNPTPNPKPEPTPQQVKALIKEQPPIIQAIIATESNGDHKAVSKTGAKGLTQLMPATARAWGVEDPFDPRQNIEGGKKNFEAELKRFGDIKLALAAYNLGGTKLAAIIKRLGTNSYDRLSHALPAETRAYVPKVMANLNKISKA